jgi:hypothetical protein
MSTTKSLAPEERSTDGHREPVSRAESVGWSCWHPCWQQSQRLTIDSVQKCFDW